MKGLILKDFYMLIGYCRAFIFMFIVFPLLYIFSPTNTFLLLYPVMLTTMLPITLLAYDERFKWNIYAESMPYTRKDIVNAKYLILLLFSIFSILLNGGVLIIQAVITNTFHFQESCILLGIFILFSITPISIIFPFMFYLGVEKGRIAYMIGMGIIAGGACAISFSVTDISTLPIFTSNFLLLAIIISLAVCGISWLISVKCYEKREL